MTDYPGIDYSLGQSNYDPKNPSFHYGVISQHSLVHWLYDELETHYSEYCPHCGNELSNGWEDNDSHCPFCDCEIIDGDQYGEEPDSQYLDSDGYYGELCSHGELFLLKSDYYTFAQYCSPCFPGAGNLDSPCENGPKTYCFSHDWFESGVAPYPVLRVSDDSLVIPQPKDN